MRSITLHDGPRDGFTIEMPEGIVQLNVPTRYEFDGNGDVRERIAIYKPHPTDRTRWLYDAAASNDGTQP